MRERAEAMVLASFAADSHALGAHWMYDMEEISSRYGRVERLLPPAPESFHNGRTKGDLTHYGDQTLVLLRHLAQHDGFEVAVFAAEWREFMTSYDGYLDGATRETLANLKAGHPITAAASQSSELSAAARIAPLAYLYRDECDRLVVDSAAQAALTHGSPIVSATAAYLSRVCWIVLNGKTPQSALRATAETTNAPEITELIRSGLDSTQLDTREAARVFGQGGDAKCALPLAIHLIAKYEGSLEQALVENVATGGDSAARGMIVGMILGAFHGRDAIPDDWISELRAYREISALLEDLEAIIQRGPGGAAKAV